MPIEHGFDMEGRGSVGQTLFVMSEDQAVALEQAWTRALRWCRRHAPAAAASIQPGASLEALASAQRETRAWPPELVAMLSVADGVGRSVELIPPLFVPLGVDDIVETWRMLAGMRPDLHSPEELSRLGSEPAGTRSFAYLPVWIPFASDFGGNYLFVDPRPGSRQGCINQWDRDEGSLRPPLWPNLTTLVEQVANALRTKRWRGADGNDLIPIVENGRLRWEDSDEWETLSWNPTLEDLAPKDPLPTRVMLLSGSGLSDREIASRLGIGIERVAELREEWRRTH